MSLNPNEEMQMTYTSVLAKDGKPMVSLQFMRGADTCEATVPECKITKNNGFSEEEVTALEQYLAANRKMIIESSKAITGIEHMWG